MEEKEQRFLIKYFWMKTWTSKKIHPELVATLGADGYGRSQVKIWPQKFRNGDLYYKDAPRPGRPALTMGPQLVVFL
jgi:hypothetical protein